MPNAHLILVLCLCTVAFGFITPRSDGAKKIDNTHCPVISCVGDGQPCKSSDCSTCYNTFSQCFSGSNDPSAWCNCYNQLVTCLVDYPMCDAFQMQDQCFDFFKEMGSQCACGGQINPPPATICNFQDYCGDDHKCHALKPTNATCADNDQCASHQCVNGVCYDAGWAFPGDSCQSSSDCVGSPLTNCVNGVCVGGSLGSTCQDNTCAFGLYCEPTTQKCANIKSPGQSCARDEYGNDIGQCGFFGICGFNDKCVNLFSQPSGSRCNQTVECQFGLYCSDSGQCSTPTDKTCSSDSDCAAGHYCSCNYDGTSTCSGSQPAGPSSCQSPAITFIKCVAAHKCDPAAIGLYNIHSGSCVDKYCRNEGNCFINCVIGSNSFYPASCFGEPLPCNNNY